MIPVFKEIRACARLKYRHILKFLTHIFKLLSRKLYPLDFYYRKMSVLRYFSSIFSFWELALPHTCDSHGVAITRGHLYQEGHRLQYLFPGFSKQKTTTTQQFILGQYIMQAGPSQLFCFVFRGVSLFSFKIVSYEEDQVYRSHSWSHFLAHGDNQPENWSTTGESRAEGRSGKSWTLITRWDHWGPPMTKTSWHYSYISLLYEPKN